ncbi:GNAT family N-acetyltransferase [Actinoplanes hulinensis]|uniref:GNAT family N-acetyltransferase n=1 Tax=Actinoplanes hulinensis TaxID=1144547 RepID=A0ABS7AXM5_9ACTN|nr:GNAT family protein [Actinoplanes hulinensis]MBW6433475.1 GNAT family N-acetyltransferase [Actinoplanes hulinensis]
MLPTEIPTLPLGPIQLRPFRETDAEVVMSAATDPLIPLITTVPDSGRRTDALAFIKRQQERLPSGIGYSFAIAETARDEAVGQIGLWLHDYRHGRASIGYWLAPQHRGHGYASAALRALTRWARTLPDIARLELYVEPWNEASWQTAERADFRREGLLRSWQPVGHERRDMYMYSLLATDATA